MSFLTMRPARKPASLSVRLRADTISRRRVMAMLAGSVGASFAAPFLAPSPLTASTATGRMFPVGHAEAAPAPISSHVIRAHQAALPLSPHADDSKTRFALSVEDSQDALLRLPAGRRHTLRLVNELPHAIIPRLRGVSAIADQVIAPGAGVDLVLSEMRAGTHLLELRGPQAVKVITGKATADHDATNAAWPVLPLIVVTPHGTGGSDALMRDEVLLIEEWPLTRAGTGAGSPGMAAQTLAGQPIPLTANRLPRTEFFAPAGGTLRLRLINATPRRMLSLLLPDWTPSVIAIDGEYAEPFTPKDRQIVLAPGNRMDVLLSVPKEISPAQAAVGSIFLHDGIRARTIAQIKAAEPGKPAPMPAPMPAPSPGAAAAAAIVAAPDRPDLMGAQRVELAFTPPASGTRDAGLWRVEEVPAPASPAFLAARGRTISLALRNDFSAPVAIHLGGHRARLLDRLDDGWKPFWLDTIAVEPNETIRLAFVASNIGAWDIEATVLASAPPSAGNEKHGAGTNGAFRFVATFSVV